MLSARDLVRRLAAGELNAVDVVEICAKAITAREDEIGAFAALDIERARSLARDPALATTPLRGLPVGMKDIIDTVDFPTEYGSPIYRGHRPASDATVVSMMRRAGGILLGKTVTTEFAHRQSGRTRNPHNKAHTPGGSSSGSAAAIAAGMLPLAVGTQTGGSVVRPAAYCGVAGFKPSFKLLPTIGVKCLSWHLDTVGLFAASVADVAFAAGALTGRDLAVDAHVFRSPHVRIVRDHLWPEASEAMRGAVETAAHAAARAGAVVDELQMPALVEDAWRAHPTIQDYEAYRAFAFEYDHHRERIAAPTRDMLDAAAAITVDQYDAARRIARKARQALGEIIKDGDVLLTPPAHDAAPHGFASTGSPAFNRLWTLMGAPVVNVPGLTNAAGMPLGVQVIGRFGRDRSTLAAAHFIETALKSK
jgi:Asp-tRNA(Asn)/Glu-tRNA(Gln) amidotransferase A subunit family amidase